MKIIWMLCLCLGAAGCEKDPLSDRVGALESQVAELRAQTTASQQALLGQLDQIAVTPENAATVAAIRAKLGQASLGQTDLASLQAQIEALARQVVNWAAPATQAAPAVYAVLYGVFPATNKSQVDLTDSTQVVLTFLGTAFAAGDQTLVTNGHMVDGLLAMDNQLKQRNTRRRTNLQGAWLVTKNLTTALHYRQNYFFIGGYATHPDWHASDVSSVDVGLLRVQEGTLPAKLKLVSTNEALALRTGQPIATLGFPGELQGEAQDNYYPIATFKDGTISALRPAQAGHTYTASDTYIVQHNLDLSGGTSGSPILNPAGLVVAVNNSGIESRVGSTQVAQGALGFGIRADKIQELLARNPAAKPVVGTAALSRWLEGRELKEQDFRWGGEDLDQRLDELEKGQRAAASGFPSGSAP